MQAKGQRNDIFCRGKQSRINTGNVTLLTQRGLIYTGTVTGGAAPVLLDDDDFVEAGSPLPWSKEYLVTIDFDGGAGGNSANVTVVLFLSE